MTITQTSILMYIFKFVLVLCLPCLLLHICGRVRAVTNAVRTCSLSPLSNGGIKNMFKLNKTFPECLPFLLMELNRVNSKTY